MASESAPRLALTVTEYLDDCQARGLAPKTYLRAYAYPLRAVLLPFCGRQGIEDAGELDQRALNRLASELHDRVAPATVKTYLKSVNVFLAWAERQALAGKARAPEPRLRRRHLDVLSRAEMDRLEDAAPTERDKLIVRLLCDTGAREGEAAALRPGDVIAREGAYFVRLRGKTGERLAPIRAALHARLRRYAERGRPQSYSDRLFVALRRARGGGDYEPLTESGVYQLVKEAATRSGIGRRIYPHLLRHSAITHMVTQGMHPVLASEITGVSVQVIAAHYTHPTDKQRWEAMMRALQVD